ncbi:heavy-metal-associated domain-containing protein [Clostridium tagluense]|uniref:heavy-metal-associated domain-containing protein n=1 Tax=Clostridium TaxID=1485 RepID=UPI0013E96899|nr:MULTISPECIES: heavy metal-associated domain-containing protein [Clostridium]MBU3126971.1 heavy-metal-associated domain-containing protein [Clostridium tagluense]MBW9155552.1 heavy-metal-associated domain-containing protein [Clostridium tagluense]MBZ9625368.1 heavy-metal-associated domain-containing protein [Clostridium sp. FP2]MCB2314081.1 heavy-metal-associated domain-containing protein [Clostridium tagluense]MCB2318918.1 heavy-metal-associated domain-containing protein [Clostridium taglue
MIKKILIEGMKCENCVKHVKEAVGSVEGVISVDVNLSNKSVIIETNTEVSDEAIKLAVNSEKYKVVDL